MIQTGSFFRGDAHSRFEGGKLTLKKLITSLIILIFILTSCFRSSDGPIKTYYDFEQFCADGDLQSATLLVTEQGFEENQKYGVCILTPNNYFKLFGPDLLTLDESEPKVEIHGGIALLTWRASDSKIVMIMDEIDGNWKIRTTLVDPEITNN